MQSLYQPQQFLYICRISTAVDHVAIEEDCVRRLFLYLCNQAGVLPAKRFPVKVGEENNADGESKIFKRNRAGFSTNAGIIDKNSKKNSETYHYNNDSSR